MASGLKIICLSCQKKKRAARTDRSGEEETWQLARFYPIIEVKIKSTNCQMRLAYLSLLFTLLLIVCYFANGFPFGV